MHKVLKITLYTFGCILLLLLGLVLFLNSRWGQDFVCARVEAYLRSKLKTEVHIGFLGYGIPKYIVLNDVLFLDQAKDTLLAVNTLKVDLNMLKLLHKKIDVQQIVLKGLHSHIYRNSPDTTFNYSYILDAFIDKTPSTKPKDTSSSLSFNLDKIDLEDIHTRFDDRTGGIRFSINLDKLTLKVKNMDMDHMSFHIKDLAVAGLQSEFEQDTSLLPPVPPDTAKSMLKLIADNVDLQHIDFKYNNNLNKFVFATQLGALQLQLNEYNQGNNRIDIKKLAVSNSDGWLTIGKTSTPPAPIDTIVKIDTTEGWNVSAKDVDLAGINFKMDNENEPKLQSGFDYSHLDIRGLAMSLQNLLYSDTVSGNLKHFAVTDQSGLDVRELKTVFNYNKTGVILKDLLLQTPNTILKDHIELHYPSLAALQKNMQSLQLKLNIENSIVGLHDAALFMPYLQKQPLFRKYKNGHLRLDAVLTGFLNKLDITRFYALGLENTEILLNGRLNGLPEPKNLSYNLHIAKFNSSRNDIEALLPPGTLPASIRIPDRFGAVGQVAGTAKDYNADIVFASTDGMAYLKGSVVTSPGSGKERYDLLVKTTQLDLGHILKQDSLMGPISANFAIKGNSFNVKTMNASADGTISSAYLEGYRYHDITMDGKVAAQNADVNLQSADSNFRVQLKGHANFSGKYAAVVADVQIDSVNFQALKLYSTELRARGEIHVDFPVLNPDYPQGGITWWQPVIVADGKRYFMDSVYASSHPNDDSGQNIHLNLGVLDASITGKTPLTKIGAIVQDHINRHYTTASSDSLKIDLAKIMQKTKSKSGKSLVAQKPVAKDTTIPADYNLKLVAHAYDKPMLHSLLPGLTSLDPVNVTGSLTPRTLTFDATAPEIVYADYTLENGNLQLRGTDSALTYKLTLDQVTQPSSSFALYYADIHGALNQSVLTTDISLSDAGRKERFAVKASMTTTGDSQIIKLNPGLKLNYNEWRVSEPNRIVLSNKGFYVQNFGIINGDQSIKANSEVARANTPLKVDISNFKLANLTDIMSKNDTLLANGVLGGNLTIEQMNPVVKMTGDVQIQNLSIYNDTLGNLKAQIDNKIDDQLTTKISLTGNGNDISLTGFYSLKANTENALNFDLNVKALDAHTFEGVAMHQVKNSSGYLRGDLKVQGTFSKPDITGELRTDNLKTTVTTLNADFKMPSEKVEFAGDQISFNNFTLSDSAGNKAQVTGTVGISDLTDPDLKLSITAHNWRAVHNTAKENKDIYGDLTLSAKLDISGTASVPSIDGNIHILKGTKLTVANPSNDPEVQSTKGIVVFVNMRDTSWGKALMPRTASATKPRHKLSAGSEMNVNITVDKEAEFSVVIDEASGDFINVRGEAYINTAITPGGQLAVTGSYLLKGGVYQMNYNFIRRRFIIQDGSMINFAGDPLKNTTLDVSATYQSNTPAYDLVMRQVTDPAQLNYYKQSLPFDVNLHMTGNMMQPAFSFDVVLPENKVYPLTADQIELIQAKLIQVRQDTSEMNKQVFAVLILGRFVSDDPFSSGAGQSVGFTAIQSVSTFIGEELNQAASKLVKGVDLSVDLATTQDYTTGDARQRSDLNIAASKRVLNDRLKLTVGNDFEVEGPQTNNNQNSMVPSNLAADYLLSGDGRYTIRAYRQNYNEGVLEGYVTETGLNFIVSVDYDRFKTIFERHPKKKQIAAAKNDSAQTVTGPVR